MSFSRVVLITLGFAASMFGTQVKAQSAPAAGPSRISAPDQNAGDRSEVGRSVTAHHTEPLPKAYAGSTNKAVKGSGQANSAQSFAHAANSPIGKASGAAALQDSRMLPVARHRGGNAPMIGGPSKVTSGSAAAISGSHVGRKP